MSKIIRKKSVEVNMDNNKTTLSPLKSNIFKNIIVKVGFYNSNKACHSDYLTPILSTTTLCSLLDPPINVGEIERLQGRITT